MNKLTIYTLLATGLLLLNSPEAAAHGSKHGKHYGPKHSYAYSYRHYGHRDRFYGYDRYRHYGYAPNYRRVKHMPRWLSRNRSFVHWYDHTHHRRDRRLAWEVLFDIYRWEHSHHRYRRY